MKQTVLDVLMYLFEHYMGDEAELANDRAHLHAELCGAGFEDEQVEKAFDWLQALADAPGDDPGRRSPTPGSVRIYSHDECRKLDVEARGLLASLERIGVLDGVTRELVIDRVMALEADDIDLEQLKWVALMVLYNQPEREDAFVWMETLIASDPADGVH